MTKLAILGVTCLVPWADDAEGKVPICTNPASEAEAVIATRALGKELTEFYSGIPNFNGDVYLTGYDIKVTDCGHAWSVYISPISSAEGVTTGDAETYWIDKSNLKIVPYSELR